MPITERNRFSKFTKDPADLFAWLKSFEQGHIPAAIVLTDNGYALYRTGMEDIVDELD